MTGSNGGTFVIDADGSYSFDPGSAFQYLGVGESTTTQVSYTVSDLAGATSVATLTITIQGTNDGVTITSGVQADTVVEETDLSAAGTVAFNDIDVADVHTAAFAQTAGSTTLGAFALAAVSEDAGTEPGSVGWTYTLNNAAAQYLGANDSVTEVYTVTVTDEAGASATQDVTITIQGTNDGVTITSGVQADTVVEETDLSAAGTVAFNDIDVADVHTAAFAQTAGSTTLGAFALAAVSEDAGTEPGSVGWTYTLNNAAAQYLGANDSVTEVYTVTVTDEAGASATQDVTITIQGTNDGVTITSGVQADTVVEETDLSAAGTVAFNDIDVADVHTAAFAQTAGSTTLGAFALAAVSEDAGTEPGSVGWTYTLNNAAAQYLGANDSVTEVYTVTVTDEAGASATQDVTITIQGTNDGVTITSGVQADTVVEETDLSAAGTVAFNDIDVADVHTAAFAQTAGSTTLGAFALAACGEDAGTEPGSVGWTYTLNNAAAQYLGANDSVTEVYTVTVTDEAGASATQDVTITIQGTNDGVTITSGVQADTVVEETDLSAAGTVAFNDIDVADVHTAAFAQTAGSTTLGAFALAAVSEDAGTEPGSVGWTYTLNNAAAQYLGANDSVTEVYTVTVTDEAGASATQDVTITIQGTNDGRDDHQRRAGRHGGRGNRPERRRHGGVQRHRRGRRAHGGVRRRRLAAPRWAPWRWRR